ncbi:MAG: hypothetical protein A2787_01615 [Omnitrophica WOR_2 bacterium RIFCSPHIGHO2_01_FULL_48_9]|nr:MAG: hypothetical protein A3D10_06180 [Omnitrophica WOR_2 bacterium RIFCSPHIGHO2_02_FULL_48_11]OGX34086.1 MAG: hypothetical protein A2787_01615 [Omnitrophica WOR_2 bacterium RIFCSPHIGHO2_01_FULL_48_9]
MSQDILIKVEGVSKKFSKSIRDSMISGITDIGLNLLGMSSNSETLGEGEFWAVNDVSFEVARGETLGLIGSNGSGKTTLLKMINGIFWPDRGKIMVKGRVGALIAVGAGFHPLLTGRENIYINAAILGMTKAEVSNKFDAIVDFADIGDFLDTPVKHYSSGMFVRLGFAIAVHSHSEILLVDEVLSVGDIKFQAKCMNKMKQLDRDGVTIIFVSHSLNSVELLCDKTVYISKGKVKYQGNTREVLAQFKKDAFEGKEIEINSVRIGTKEIEVQRVDFLDNQGKSKKYFKRGEDLTVKICFEAKGTFQSPEFSVGFNTDEGIEVSKATTRDHSFTIDEVSGKGELNYVVKALPFNLGKYLISIGCWDSTGHVAYDHQEKMYEIIIEDGVIDSRIHERFGLVHVPARWSLHKNA